MLSWGASAQTPLAPEEQEAIVAANAEARIEALQFGMLAVALVALLGLFPTRRLRARRSRAMKPPRIGAPAAKT